MRLNEIQGSPTFESTAIDDQEIKTLRVPYLVLPAPAVGCSYRWDGNSVDVSAGLLGIDCTYSKMLYFHKDYERPGGFYGSVGVGAGVGLFPTYYIYEWEASPKIMAPIRFGYEGKRGFFDVGVSITYMVGNYIFDKIGTPLPIPEIRGGLRF
jgi:hypothetical protein